MYSPTLTEGSTFMYRGAIATVAQNPSKYLVLDIEGFSEPATLKLSDFFAEIEDHVQPIETPKILVQHSELTTQKEIDLAQKYQDYLLPLLEEAEPCGMSTRERVIDRVAAQRGDTGKNKPSRATLYNWFKKFTSDEVDKNIVAMVNPTKRKRGRQAPEWALEMFHDFVDEHYMKRKKDGALSKKETIDGFIKLFQEKLQELPEDERQHADKLCQSTCYDILAQYDPVQECIIREGHSEAVKKYRTSTDHFIAERPLQLIQIDALHINLALRDEAGNYIGLVVIYFAIDVCTRAVLGFVISVAKQRREDLSAAVELLKSILVPKEKPAYTEHDWPLFGTPEKMQHDSGIFKGQHFQAFCLAAGINLYQTPAGRPWFNAIVERFHRTFRTKCCKLLPGYAGKRTDEIKDSTNIKQTPYMTMEQLRRATEIYILDVYHQTPHKGLDGETPYQACMRLKGVTNHRIPDPERYKQLMIYRGVKDIRKLQGHKGIEYNGVFYMDSQNKLIKLWKKLGGRKGYNPEVEFFYSELDISAITVINPLTNERIEIPSTSIKERTSLAEHKARRSKNGGKRKPVDAAKTLAPVINEAYAYKDEIKQAKEDREQDLARKRRDKEAKAQQKAQERTNFVSADTAEKLINENAAGINEPPENQAEYDDEFKCEQMQKPRRRSKKAKIGKV